ncbi:NADH-quinone oxidoreductase subunit J [Cyanobacterium aponinum UTEX 3222]|uniref:NADH-quinone oxidoreductase subunit J n=2 Tax=Cyanobacterium aponinum TaxID=379064 RepID=K9Z3G3_CYAAP|nr:NADH-quinone oxidoreductase subunit J [Cyanobacterium aponinum]MBD2395913.1 NADH-quinone oxidoreductase subunit J [Cyanobacterium aponinum FACHB-4101]WRL41366.1 NADH-quinone oxidoreductase subunit J [Cyanobacterium aponinum UTEX 3222]AFZ53731.1 NADH dehydrogenase subunit J [Cyanobacterium aponinum PCC 10605]PHV61177.1 NADH:ubiquinone oxidoreductase subunit J [Cyanobacterium aponinum IPPAS B-1201]WPF89558.1 NADH-quinone oxidoreductase subunit J [Cyanobacterium aponinum AL20115]
MEIAQSVQFVAFVILSLLMIGGALGVVLFENIVYSAFLLGGVFLSISGLYILLNADFVAAAQILIYVGAINVLILFAIMLVNKTEVYQQVRGRLIRQVSTALVCVGLFALLGTMVLATPWQLSETSPAVVENTIVAIGKHFFSDYLLPFEIASVLLLMAMVGAIILARRDLIPEAQKTTEVYTTSFTLPEQPRELITTGNDNDNN